MSTPKHSYTPAEIEEGIHRALSEGAVAVVPGLLRLLALQSPRRAEVLLETIERGLAMGKAADGGVQLDGRA